MKKSFSEECSTNLKKVPTGKVTTYKELAHSLNCKAYRAVGSTMNKNPYAKKVPCHKIVKSNADIGGFASGTNNKAKMLKKEGIKIKNNKVQNFNKVLYKF